MQMKRAKLTRLRSTQGYWFFNKDYFKGGVILQDFISSNASEVRYPVV